jgi:thioredoxin-like negative regulator of GroEL
VLGPILEDVVNEVGEGKVKMAKIDVDTNSEVAAYLNVTAIPAVFAFCKNLPSSDPSVSVWNA